MTEETLVFLCDEAACREDAMFYEMFTMDERWEIIRAILKAVQGAAPAPPSPIGIDGPKKTEEPPNPSTNTVVHKASG